MLLCFPLIEFWCNFKVCYYECFRFRHSHISNHVVTKANYSRHHHTHPSNNRCNHYYSNAVRYFEAELPCAHSVHCLHFVIRRVTKVRFYPFYYTKALCPMTFGRWSSHRARSHTESVMNSPVSYTHLTLPTMAVV